jgi:hypothetical protein
MPEFSDCLVIAQAFAAAIYQSTRYQLLSIHGRRRVNWGQC